jgi:hypothetical protein
MQTKIAHLRAVHADLREMGQHFITAEGDDQRILVAINELQQQDGTDTVLAVLNSALVAYRHHHQGAVFAVIDLVSASAFFLEALISDLEEGGAVVATAL